MKRKPQGVHGPPVMVMSEKSDFEKICATLSKVTGQKLIYEQGAPGDMAKVDPVLGQHFEGMYERYYSSGMHLKCSGQLRTMANERPDSSSYRPLPYPPPTSSPYHKYGNLMSRLECLEAIIDFCYAFWAKDFWHKKVDRNAWRGLQPFLAFTRAHWEQDAVDDREKALLGLL